MSRDRFRVDVLTRRQELLSVLSLVLFRYAESNPGGFAKAIRRDGDCLWHQAVQTQMATQHTTLARSATDDSGQPSASAVPSFAAQDQPDHYADEDRLHGQKKLKQLFVGAAAKSDKELESALQELDMAMSNKCQSHEVSDLQELVQQLSKLAKKGICWYAVCLVRWFKIPEDTNPPSLEKVVHILEAKAIDKRKGLPVLTTAQKDILRMCAYGDIATLSEMKRNCNVEEVAKEISRCLYKGWRDHSESRPGQPSAYVSASADALACNLKYMVRNPASASHATDILKTWLRRSDLGDNGKGRLARLLSVLDELHGHQREALAVACCTIMSCDRAGSLVSALNTCAAENIKVILRQVFLEPPGPRTLQLGLQLKRTLGNKVVITADPRLAGIEGHK